jgi:hypothetical protein
MLFLVAGSCCMILSTDALVCQLDTVCASWQHSTLLFTAAYVGAPCKVLLASESSEVIHSPMEISSTALCTSLVRFKRRLLLCCVMGLWPCLIACTYGCPLPDPEGIQVHVNACLPSRISLHSPILPYGRHDHRGVVPESLGSWAIT